MFDERSYIRDREKMYKKNLASLKKNYPHYAEKVERQAIFQDFHIMPTGKNKEINVYSVKQDRFIYDVENPYKSVKKEFKKIEGNYHPFIILFGVGIGHELTNIGKIVSQNGYLSALILIEKSIELFKLSMYEHDYAKTFENEGVFFLLDESDNDIFTKTFDYLNNKNSKLKSLISVAKFYYYTNTLLLDKNYYLSAINAMKKATDNATIYIGNSPEDSLIGLENMLKNMDEIIDNPGINLLYDKFKGKPAVIVSTGPSLNKNKHLLKEMSLYDKALIICPEASLKILIEMGIKPHIITSLERVPEVVNLVKGFDYEDIKDVYYAACPVVVPEVYETYKGPRLIAYRNFNHFKWTEVDRGILNIKASSGNMAYKLADSFGCDPIVLIGQDLAYTRDGRSHAKGAVYGETSHLDKSDIFKEIEVMGNDGDMIPSNETLKLFKEQYEVDISLSSSKCINATEGGAYIAGTEVMTFQEAIDKYINEVFDPMSIIKENLSKFNKDEAAKDRENFIKICESSIDELKEIVSLCEKGLDYINIKIPEVEKSLKNKNYNKKKFTRYCDKISSEYGSKVNDKEIFAMLMMHTVQPVIMRLHNELSLIHDKYEGGEARTREILHHKKWFETVLKYTKITIDMIDDIYKKYSIE